MALASGHKVEVLEGEELAKQTRDWKGYKNGLVRLTPGPWVFPKHYLNIADKCYKFKFLPNDVVIATYPKCGTTWTQEIVWTIRNNPDLTNSSASIPLLFRSPFLEVDMLSVGDMNPSDDQNPFMNGFKMICQGKDPKDGISVQMAECTPEPRTIKTHLPFSLLPASLIDTCKVVYVARNTKDMLVSYHHHCRILEMHGYNGTWEDFIQYFVDDDLVYGSYAQHVREAWEKRNHPNLHIIFFEDMKVDVMGELKRLDAFLGTNLTPQQLDVVARYTSFKEMKKREDVTIGMADAEGGFSVFNRERVAKDGGFFRKGDTGDWKNKFSPELEAKVDAWMEKNMNIGVDFKYSI